MIVLVGRAARSEVPDGTRGDGRARVEKIRIHGGARLSGTVEASGSKNATLPMLAACLMIDGPVVLEGVPRLRDVDGLLHMLQLLGVDSTWLEDGSLRLEVVDDSCVHAPYHLVRTMRASFCLLGPLWSRRGRAIVSYPGGCVFGHRPIDLHIKGLKALGADIDLTRGNVHCSGRVRGGQVFLGGSFGSTVLGTANIVMAACLGDGETVIDCAAQEPEVVDLCRFLNACGARISGIGSHRLHVQGVSKLIGCRWRVIPDRIEAGTLLVAGAMTRGEVEVRGARPEHLAAVLDRLRAAGVPLEIGERDFDDPVEAGELPNLAASTPRVVPLSKEPKRPKVKPQADDNLMADRVFLDHGSQDGQAPTDTTVPFVRTLPQGELEAVDITTLPYPGFPTDLQAQFLTMMCVAEGVSVITEKVYPERFIHVAELARLGARVRREGPTAIIQGPSKLSGATMMASDLRASAALVLAGLVADGVTEVRRVYHLDRGYERLHKKLSKLGAHIERVHDA